MPFFNKLWTIFDYTGYAVWGTAIWKLPAIINAWSSYKTDRTNDKIKLAELEMKLANQITDEKTRKKGGKK